MHNATTDPVAEDAATEKTEDDAPRMTRGELASILRGGAGALAKWGGDGQDAFTEFRDSTFADLRERGKERDEKKEVGIMVEAGEKVGEEQRRRLELEDEEAEKLLLAGREAVQARCVFSLACWTLGFADGVWDRQEVRGSDAQAVQRRDSQRCATSPSASLALLTTFAEWDQTLARASNSRTVMIDGHSVSKETIVSPTRSRRFVHH